MRFHGATRHEPLQEGECVSRGDSRCFRHDCLSVIQLGFASLVPRYATFNLFVPGVFDLCSRRLMQRLEQEVKKTNAFLGRQGATAVRKLSDEIRHVVLRGFGEVYRRPRGIARDGLLVADKRRQPAALRRLHCQAEISFNNIVLNIIRISQIGLIIYLSTKHLPFPDGHLA